MSTRFETMGESHVQQVYELEKRCFSTPWSIESFYAELINTHAVYFVAMTGIDVSGYAGMHIVGEDGYVTNVAVLPERRRAGIGDGLLCALTQEARSRGCSVLTLEVRASNAAAIALYEKHAFRIVGHRRGYYTHPDEDACIMLRII